MDAKQELLDLQLEMCFHNVKLIMKRDHWYFRLLGFIMKIFFKNDDFMTRVTTTIGKTIALHDGFYEQSDVDKLETLTHEFVHVKQFEKWHILASLGYLLVFFPVGLAYVRYRMERVAYAKGFNKMLQYNPGVRAQLVDWGVQEMCGSSYGWAWPFKKSVRAWFEANLDKPSL